MQTKTIFTYLQKRLEKVNGYFFQFILFKIYVDMTTIQVFLKLFNMIAKKKIVINNNAPTWKQNLLDNFLTKFPLQ